MTSVRDYGGRESFVFMGTKCAEIKQESCIIGFLAVRVSVGFLLEEVPPIVLDLCPREGSASVQYRLAFRSRSAPK